MSGYKTMQIEKGYEKLAAVFQAAHDQAAHGKGKERHANGLPFHEQRMQSISKTLASADGMAYQVIKKMTEGLQFDDHKRREKELLGAINYLAGIVIYFREAYDSKDASAKTANWPESADARIDIIGANGNDGEHYAEQAGGVTEPLTPAELMQQTWFMNSATLEDRDAFIANGVPVESREDWDVQANPAICGYSSKYAEVCSWFSTIGDIGASEIHRIGNNFYWGAPE